MNAMEMMAKAALERLLDNIPPETLDQVKQIGQFVVTVDQRLRRMEADQRLIMAHLGIPTTGENHDGNETVRGKQPDGIAARLGYDGPSG